ncbi:MAG: hypothetical protein ACM3JB_03235 [Acidobacteriaceae bacterium]
MNSVLKMEQVGSEQLVEASISRRDKTLFFLTEGLVNFFRVAPAMINTLPCGNRSANAAARFGIFCRNSLSASKLTEAI